MNQIDHILKGLCEFMTLMVSHHLAMLGGHWPSASGDIKYLSCHETSQNHVTEGWCNFMRANSS